jgi:fumarylacetoacetase
MAADPEYLPTRALDYEVEAGFFVGPGNALGTTIPLDRAEEHLFGLCLLNDWSARDVQKWEYQPLGPFLGKNFATTLSPWVVTLEALAPFRVPAAPRPEGDPAPLPHLVHAGDAARGGFDVILDLFLSTAVMRAQGLPPHRLSRSRLRDLYWTPGQMLAHHASNGCNLRSGDLLGTGTLSGPGGDARGCLLELTAGNRPVTLPGGEQRRFLEDGDLVTLRGACEAPGFRRIGFGACSGEILPSQS